MKFFEHLFCDLDSYSVYNPSNISPIKNEGEELFLNNFQKTPEHSVALLAPNNFNEVLKFIHFISGNRSAVVDFNNLSNNEIVRAVDFVGGAVLALHGQMEKVANGIYLFTPSCTKLMINKRKKRKNEK